MPTFTNRDVTTTEKWREAQKWEEAHWVNAQRMRAKYFKNYVWKVMAACGVVSRYRGDDYNSWWKTQFNNYAFLPPTVGNALEVGCGPYTNIRLMVDTCQPKHLVLSDPLIRTYVKFKMTFVSDMYRSAFCTLDDHPLEELPYVDNYFDLVVMINVLDHVQDARKCMENVIRVTRPGGYLVIGQDLTNDQDLEAMKNDPGAVGHPIKLGDDWFHQFTDKGFDPVINRVLSREEGRSPENHYGTLLFAGRKLS